MYSRSRFHVVAIHPDLFLASLFDDDAVTFLQGVQLHRASLKNPPKTSSDYIDTLITNDLSELSIRIGMHQDSV
jgi:hypothetical protein